MQKYNSYKPSRLDWIGEIPTQWGAIPLKYIASIAKGKKAKEEFRDYSEGLIPYLSMEFLRNQTDSPVYVKADDSIVFVDENDLLILWDGSKAGEIVKAKNGALSSTMGKIHIEDKSFNLDFLTYFLKCAQPFLQGNTIGMGIPHVDGEILRNLMIVKPTIQEQNQITNYLNHQTTVIDNLIQQKEKLIQLLKEKRQSIINETITKGINQNAIMKDTKLEWLGQIPTDWIIVKLKHVVDMKSGNFISAEMIEDEGLYPVYGGNGIRGYYSEYSHEGYFPLIGRQGALCGNINYANGKFWPTEHAVVVSPKKEVNIFWIGELLRLMNLNQYSQASAQPGLSVEKILNLNIPLPTIDEQNQIASKLLMLIEKFELAHTELEESIIRLKEYRQCLITEVVTGKIDVSEWQPHKQQVA